MTDILERLAQAQVKADAIPDLSVNIFRDAAAEIERLRAASEWRDISTAPRDGTWVLVASEDLYPCDAQWAVTDLAEGWFDIGGFFSTQPTRWMPLPAPPQRNEVTKPNLEEPRG